jgi:hypothetical protein
VTEDEELEHRKNGFHILRYRDGDGPVRTRYTTAGGVAHYRRAAAWKRKGWATLEILEVIEPIGKAK